MQNDNISTLYSELGKFHGAISQLLQTINVKIDTLPDNRDFVDITEKLKHMLKEIEEVKQKYDKHDSQASDIKSTTVKTDNNITKFQNQLTEMIDKINYYINQLNETHTATQQMNRDIQNQLNNINKLTTIITDEISRTKTLLENENENLTLYDLNEVVKFSKRSNERHEYWKGWKGRIAIISGIIVGVGYVLTFVLSLVKTIMESM